MSRRAPIRGVVLGDTHEVLLRDAPDRLSLLAAGSPQAMIAMAEAEAGAIVAEAELAREQMLGEGYRQGYEAGLADAVQQLSGAIAAVRAAGDALDAQLEVMPERLAQEVAALGLEVAARLVRAELAARPERVVDVVRGAIRKATDREVLIARVNPDDLGMMRMAADELMLQMGGIRRLDVIEDPRVHSGGCVLETPSGDVDATMESQLRRILEALAAPPDHELVEQPAP